MHYGQMLQSHALHFFHLASPDLLFGMDADPPYGTSSASSPLTGTWPPGRAPAQVRPGDHPGHGGEEDPRHGRRARAASTRTSAPRSGTRFLKGPAPLTIDRMIAWAAGRPRASSRTTTGRTRTSSTASPTSPRTTSASSARTAPWTSTTASCGPSTRTAARSSTTWITRTTSSTSAKRSRSWSYMKFPYLRALGKADGWYRVGPLARLNTCDYIPSPLAQKEFEAYKAYTDGKPNNMSPPHALGPPHRAPSRRRGHQGAPLRQGPPGHEARQDGQAGAGRGRPHRGAARAPSSIITGSTRDDQITMANLIVSTTNNNEPMNRAVHWVADERPLGEARDHGGHAQPRRSGHPGL